MNKTWLSAMAGVLFSASLLFAQAGGGAAAGSSMGGTTRGMGGTGPGISRTARASPPCRRIPTMGRWAATPGLAGSTATARTTGRRPIRTRRYRAIDRRTKAPAVRWGRGPAIPTTSRARARVRCEDRSPSAAPYRGHAGDDLRRAPDGVVWPAHRNSGQPP